MANSKLEEGLREKKAHKMATKKRSEAQFEKIYKVALGDDWRAIEAQSVQAMIMRDQHRANAFQDGIWIERGPTNIPGRINDLDIDYSYGSAYAISAHGILFKSSDLCASAWSQQNDRFPLGLGVASQLEVFTGGDLATSGYIKSTNQWGVFYSTNQGVSWEVSSGLGPLHVMGYRRLLKDMDSVYLLVQEYAPQMHTDYDKVYKSTNSGSSFEQLYCSTILYQLDYPTQHFEQIGIPGMNYTQIYKMVSRQADLDAMYIGTHDNGYCYTTYGNVQQEVVGIIRHWGGV